MKKVIKSAIIAVGFIGLVSLLPSCTEDDSKVPSTDKPAIEALLQAYQQALNASDANQVTQLFTATGVLMANGASTAEGSQQVKGTYQYVFDNFRYTLQFSVQDIIENGNTAFITSTSKGSFVIKASGQTVSDENRELFVLEKVNGDWKIASYIYNKDK